MSCPDCFKGTAKDGTPSGTMSTLHGVTVYVAAPSPSTSIKSNSKIIYFPDAFGHTFVNNRLLADTYAARTGMQVLLPDVIPGGSLSPAVLPLMDVAMEPVAWWDVFGQIKRVVSFVRIMWIGLPWMIKAKPKNAMPTIIDFARAVRRKLPSDAKLGVCGFCWGGYPSTALCAEPLEVGSTERLVDAQFCAHPSYLETPASIVEAVQKFKVPYALAAAEKDVRMKAKDVDETEAALRQKVGKGNGDNGYHYEIVRYANCNHGFAVRAKPDDRVEMEAAGRACEQAIEWFKRWL